MGELPELEHFHAELKNLGSGVKAVDMSQLHVTLKFLGDTDESQLPKLNDIMHGAINRIGPLTIRLHGSGTFPPKGNARVVWVGLEGAGPLGVIATRLEASCRGIGFEAEGRAFKPHLTLARIKDPMASGSAISLVERYATSEFGSVDIDRIFLKRSVLGPQGPTYTTVLTLPMASQ